MSELEIGFDASTGKQAALNTLMEQIMGSYSVSDDEGPLTDAVETFLTMQPHLTVHRHGDTLVASTDFGRAQRVILAGHLDTVPVIDNFPPKWLEPGDPLIREDVAAGHEGERVIWGRGATDMKGSDAVMLYLAATLTDARYDLTYVFYDHEEVAAEKNGLRNPTGLSAISPSSANRPTAVSKAVATAPCVSMWSRMAWLRIRRVPGWARTPSTRRLRS